MGKFVVKCNKKRSKAATGNGKGATERTMGTDRKGVAKSEYTGKGLIEI